MAAQPHLTPPLPATSASSLLPLPASMQASTASLSTSSTNSLTSSTLPLPASMRHLPHFYPTSFQQYQQHQQQQQQQQQQQHVLASPPRYNHPSAMLDRPPTSLPPLLPRPATANTTIPTTTGVAHTTPEAAYPTPVVGDDRRTYAAAAATAATTTVPQAAMTAAALAGRSPMLSGVSSPMTADLQRYQMQPQQQQQQQQQYRGTVPYRYTPSSLSPPAPPPTTLPSYPMLSSSSTARRESWTAPPVGVYATQQYQHPYQHQVPAGRGSASPAPSAVSSSLTADFPPPVAVGALMPPPTSSSSSGSSTALAQSNSAATMGGSSASPPPPAAAVPAPGQVSRAPSDPPLLLFHAEEMESQVFQLECNGVQLCRREADNFVNGTKLLNLAHMTRGKRDAILKHERVRDVVKAGTMRLKGVWIPLARALVLAQLHRLETLAYPLLESDPWAYVASLRGGSWSNGSNNNSASTPSLSGADAGSPSPSQYQLQQQQQQQSFPLATTTASRRRSMMGTVYQPPTLASSSLSPSSARSPAATMVTAVEESRSDLAQPVSLTSPSRRGGGAGAVLYATTTMASSSSEDDGYSDIDSAGMPSAAPSQPPSPLGLAAMFSPSEPVSPISAAAPVLNGNEEDDEAGPLVMLRRAAAAAASAHVNASGQRMRRHSARDAAPWSTGSSPNVPPSPRRHSAAARLRLAPHPDHVDDSAEQQHPPLVPSSLPAPTLAPLAAVAADDSLPMSFAAKRRRCTTLPSTAAPDWMRDTDDDHRSLPSLDDPRAPATKRARKMSEVEVAADILLGLRGASWASSLASARRATAMTKAAPAIEQLL